MSPMEPYEVESQAVIDYRRQARVFLSQSYGFLEAGDLHQASEKGWAAVAWMAKAVAEARGWKYTRHEEFFEIMRRCEQVSGSANLVKLWPTATTLYDFWFIRKRFLSPETIKESLPDIEVLLDILEPLTEVEAAQSVHS